MNTSVREAVLDAGRALGIPEPVTEAFIRLLRPCVYLCPYDELPEELKKDARPAARARGLAHLPEHVRVPSYVPHVVTIDCAALPTGVLDIDFPADGHLVVLAEVTDCDEGFLIHLPAGTETVERRSQPESHEPFPLYAVPGTTKPDLRWPEIAEAADYAGDDAERARLVTKLIEEIGEIPGIRWRYDIQLGGCSRAWHNPVEDRGKVLFLSMPESPAFGDGCITLVSGTREQIAERRYDELEFDVEC
ncbi:hypothetical protein HD597_010839 [Nonomuraea thailandensis]|uniref:DUF1963 domain-containing protein n=1 Tax=Nonomuraea thailandensis TaxID=1188745 RepID=A0A9X2K8Q9_9ACTN|nr:hypothetical protein [Nonomuraea thailandensis]MCP2363819.1 hypothetical protein [Nonomuraea thailandensis]